MMIMFDIWCWKPVDTIATTKVNFNFDFNVTATLLTVIRARRRVAQGNDKGLLLWSNNIYGNDLQNLLIRIYIPMIQLKLTKHT